MIKCKFCSRLFDSAKNFDWILNSQFCTIQCNMWFIEFGQVSNIIDLYTFRMAIVRRGLKSLGATFRDLEILQENANSGYT